MLYEVKILDAYMIVERIGNRERKMLHVEVLIKQNRAIGFDIPMSDIAVKGLQKCVKDMLVELGEIREEDEISIVE